jgi:hypothetical protein
MKGFAILILAAIGGVTLWKNRKLVAANLPIHPEANNVQAGVQVYASAAAPNRDDQVLAALQTNRSAVSEPGFAPAFGEFENQPADLDYF